MIITKNQGLIGMSLIATVLLIYKYYIYNKYDNHEDIYIKRDINKSSNKNMPFKFMVNLGNLKGV